MLHPARGLKIGLGMDLHWSSGNGFTPDGEVQPRIGTFLSSAGNFGFEYLFWSFQPRNRNILNLDDYAEAYDKLMTLTPWRRQTAFHHTLLNLGSPENYDRRKLFEFSNVLVERYGIEWINEDLGIWSVGGKPLPYPMAPILDRENLALCIENVLECMHGLAAPLVVEFPGFTEGIDLCFGDMDAFDFFNELAEQTGCLVNIDLGHILGYLQATRRGFKNLEAELLRLPLEHCFEIHLAGCEIRNNSFRDTHHGLLHPLQLETLSLLINKCPNLRAIAYEDPALTLSGELHPRARPAVEKMIGLIKAARGNNVIP